jgi:hypothetical protein
MHTTIDLYRRNLFQESPEYADERAKQEKKPAQSQQVLSVYLCAVACSIHACCERPSKRHMVFQDEVMRNHLGTLQHAWIVCRSVCPLRTHDHETRRSSVRCSQPLNGHVTTDKLHRNLLVKYILIDESSAHGDACACVFKVQYAGSSTPMWRTINMQALLASRHAGIAGQPTCRHCWPADMQALLASQHAGIAGQPTCRHCWPADMQALLASRHTGIAGQPTCRHCWPANMQALLASQHAGMDHS